MEECSPLYSLEKLFFRQDFLLSIHDDAVARPNRLSERRRPAKSDRMINLHIKWNRARSLSLAQSGYGGTALANGTL
jgi:hypothetical protein